MNLCYHIIKFTYYQYMPNNLMQKTQGYKTIFYEILTSKFLIFA